MSSSSPASPPSQSPPDPSPLQPLEDPDEDTIRIMVSTDNHLGYEEGDAVRGNDSFAALEEVLWLAKHYSCDMVLLAGDLFHENRPSRRTLHKTMSIFRKYCWGPDPVALKILSDPSQSFRRSLPNYLDEFLAVDLPVLSIHGNHDDPSRDGSGSELYAALDLLDCCGLVNYIGRQDEVQRIRIAPILFQKGQTRLALYGLGAMRDERLNRMWQSNKLAFLRPESNNHTNYTDENESTTECFNLLALHQNRDKGRGNKNCIHESMIPEWMDLVCWGHEHECCIEPQESVVGTFRITQPGSSVATSLVAGESVRKKVGILDVRGQAFRLKPVALTQTRTFLLGEVCLADQRNLDPDDPRVETRVQQLLQEQVELLVHQAKEKRREDREEAATTNPLAACLDNEELGSADAFPLSHRLEKPDEVLVRLKVEHSGFSTLNNQRFGARFIGKVANPTDILLFQRKKAPPNPNNNTISKKKAKLPDDPIAPEDLEEMNIEDLIVGELDQPERRLELLDEKRIAGALENYVVKQQAQAIPEIVQALLGKQQKRLVATPGSWKKDDDEEEETRNHDEEEEEEEEEAKAPPSRKRKTSRATSPPAKKRAASSRAGSKSRSKTVSYKEDSDDHYDEEEEEDIVVVEPPKKTRGKRITAKATASSRSRRNASFDEDDYQDDNDDDDEIEEVAPPPKTARRGGRATKTTSTRRKRATPSMSLDEDSEAEEIISDDDNDDVVVAETARKPRSKRAATTPAKRGTQRRDNSSVSPPTSGSRLSQSQLSFAPVAKKTTTSRTTKRSASTKTARGRGSSRRRTYTDDIEESEDEEPTPTRSYDLDDDWGTARTTTTG